MGDDNVKITVNYGYVILRAWIEFDGDKFIGMGSKAEYDLDGILIDFKIEPTGLAARYE